MTGCKFFWFILFRNLRCFKRAAGKRAAIQRFENMSLVFFPFFFIKTLLEFFFPFNSGSLFGLIQQHFSSVSRHNKRREKKKKRVMRERIDRAWVCVCAGRLAAAADLVSFLSFLPSLLFPFRAPPVVSSANLSRVPLFVAVVDVVLCDDGVFHINDESCKNIATCNITSPPSLAISLLWVHWSYLQGRKERIW